MPEEQIVGITGTLPYATSIGRNWTGVEVHRYRVPGPSQTIDKPLSLDHLTMMAGMSKFHFAKSFRQAMGIPPHQYLVQARMQKARALLSDETISLPQIASRVG
jgi:AraC-like DNA-binding protein